MFTVPTAFIVRRGTLAPPYKKFDAQCVRRGDHTPPFRHMCFMRANCVHGSISGGKEVKAISLPVWGWVKLS